MKLVVRITTVNENNVEVEHVTREIEISESKKSVREFIKAIYTIVETLLKRMD